MIVVIVVIVTGVVGNPKEFEFRDVNKTKAEQDLRNKHKETVKRASGQ